MYENKNYKGVFTFDARMDGQSAIDGRCCGDDIANRVRQVPVVQVAPSVVDDGLSVAPIPIFADVVVVVLVLVVVVLQSSVRFVGGGRVPRRCGITAAQKRG